MRKMEVHGISMVVLHHVYGNSDVATASRT
jgi:hypothetical protein